MVDGGDPPAVRGYLWSHQGPAISCTISCTMKECDHQFDLSGAELLLAQAATSPANTFQVQDDNIAAAAAFSEIPPDLG